LTVAIDSEVLTELEADIVLFEEMSAARVRFFDEVVAGLILESSVDARELRHESVYEIAEFFYLLGIFEVDDADKLRCFAQSHNRNILELVDNEADQKRLGVNPHRLREALFDSDEKLNRLVGGINENEIRLSQSDLSRFLVEYMSFETCRSTVKLLSEAGYLTLFKSPFGSNLIGSTGRLEKIFGRHIRSFREALAKKLGLGIRVKQNVSFPHLED
jgi:hypothetical protein